MQSQPSLCAVRSLVLPLSLSLSLSPSRVRLGLSTSSTPIEVEAYITRGAARRAAVAAAADIFGSFGRSHESRNEHKSILRRAHERVEDRTWAGFSSLFFFGEHRVRRHWGREGGSASWQRTGGGNERDEEKQDDERKGG